MTQDQLAARLGISRNMVSRVENGRGAPSVTTLAEWVSTCGATPAQAAGMLQLAAGNAIPEGIQAELDRDRSRRAA